MRGKAHAVTLGFADLLAIAGVVFGPLLVIGGGALAWLRTDIRNLRTETQSAISDLRTETQTSIDGLRTEMQASFDGLRTEMQTSFDGLRTETQTSIDGLRTETYAAINDLRIEIRATNARLDTLTQIILTSALAHGRPSDPTEAVPQTEAPRQPTPA